MEKLEAGELALAKVFSSDFVFEIPDYQRPYAWETEQANQLLEDLSEALDRNEDEPYFLGSIVLVKAHGDPAAQVIDGQQRLTTLSILLAVLRDLAMDDPEHQSEVQHFLVEPGNRILKFQAKPRLTSRKRDAEFFHKYVQKPESIAELMELEPSQLANDAQRAMRSNAIALHTTLTKWSHERRVDLVGMMSLRTFLVVVSTASLASAHRIFSVMNARGLDLSPADIFKAQVIGAITEPERYATKWEDAEDDLGRDGFADLFLHVRVIYAKTRARRELLKEFPEQVLKGFLPDKATTFVDDVLVPYATAYGEVANRTFEANAGAEKINAWFSRLLQLDNNDWRPPALWALRTHRHDVVWLDKFLRSLERLSASMFIRREYTTPRAQRYADLLRELIDDDLGLESPAFQLSDVERAETLRLLNGDVYLSAKTRKYVLLRVDEALASGAGATYDHSIITVEHVLPQTPSPTSQWMADFTDEARTMWTHRLANLLLLNRTKNSEAQNYDFTTKKERYFTGRNGVASFAITTQVLAKSAWTPAVLEERQASLMALLKSEWKL